VDYLLAVSPLPGPVIPVMRIGQHLTGAQCTTLRQPPARFPSLPLRGVTGGHPAAVMPDRTAAATGELA